MVSTRSGRITGQEIGIASFITRSRTRQDTVDSQEILQPDQGQPEVSSPAPPDNGIASSAAVASHPSLDGFYVPPATYYFGHNSEADAIPGTPLTERIVKTVGMSIARANPALTASKAAEIGTITPSAKDVQNVAGIPLPHESGSPEPYASSEEEPVVPMSPPKQQAHSTTAGSNASHGATSLLFIMPFTSLFITALIALLLSPCLDSKLYAVMDSQAYERVCKNLVVTQHNVADGIERFYLNLPPPALNALNRTWGILKVAHVAAYSAASPLVSKAKQHLIPVYTSVMSAVVPKYRDVVINAAPYMRQSLEHVVGVRARAATTASPAITVTDFMAVLDEAAAMPALVLELWNQALQNVASKQKAVVWLLACRLDNDCSMASDALKTAATASATVDGSTFGGLDSAGKLQRQLVSFVRAYPEGVVLVRRPERLHPNSLSVFVMATSEGGHLQMDGEPVMTRRAQFIFLVHYPAGMEESSLADGAAVKAWLSNSISARVSFCHITVLAMHLFLATLDRSDFQGTYFPSDLTGIRGWRRGRVQ